VLLTDVESFLSKYSADLLLSPEQVQELKDLKFKLGRHTLSVNDAVQALHRLGQSHMVEKILHVKGPIVPDQEIVDPRFNYMLLYIVTIAILWFGCNNAAKEIVKEEAIYTRERAVNLGIRPYLASKFLVLSVLTALQAGLLLLCTYGVLEGLHIVCGWQAPYAGYRLEYLELYAVMAILGTTGVAFGLLLSACVASPDRASALLPYVLIPQIILGGGIMPVTSGPLYWSAVVLSPVYWAFRAARRGATTMPHDLPYFMQYNDSPLLASAALVVQTAVLLALAAWALKQKDARTG
jgi:hypothetical protein